ncbi:hypothetical protein ACP70R_024498 [Stipagrostis hirtigluma subsp. patula]
MKGMLHRHKNMKRNSKQHLHGAIAKRREAPEVPLCNLPLEILSQILSRLPISDAIRTSVLSRKWKYVWRGHTNLTFDSATMRRYYFKGPTESGIVSDKEFIARVNTVLHQHSGLGVEHMEVKHMLNNKHGDHVDGWVNFAIASKTKELIIDLSGGHKMSLSSDLLYGIQRVREEPYHLPSQLFSADNGSCLRFLDLTSVFLQLPADFNGFMNLKNLTLVDVGITDEDVQCMLSRCNRLEFFEIAYCRLVTGIRMPHPSKQLKHLLVDRCPLLQVIELNCSPTALVYTGNMVPFIFASTSKLTNICIKFLTSHPCLYYMVTGFPSTLPSLETLTLHCAEVERTVLPRTSFKFTNLRHLSLELVLSGDEERETDLLDYGYLLEVAPFMETLELHMWMNCRRKPYRKEDGELRIHPPHQHAHLKSVRISGFFGQKDQVELALHILRSSVVLKKMEITPRVEISDCAESAKRYYQRTEYVDGHKVATEFVCKADHRNVVDVVRASFSWGPPLDYVHRTGGVQGASQLRGSLSRLLKGGQMRTVTRSKRRKLSFKKHKTSAQRMC